ncbi:hybrid sensor histidine kinase/response regulator [Desulfuromonas sp. TF]|uniref:hybrid sensor histidine kinase/response regulator n=1 Tax=Desulfuromonas sp. TF TaxID=1232410 RepID=UPI0004265DF9|nr:hybrid sensor histidine kinase/response regulator [Desulfuromonas sp. TF]
MGSSKFTILVVDDSPTQLAMVQDTLEKEGFNVETAQDGVEAINKVYHSPPSLILSDVMMPELNGYHLCRLLKNDPRTAHIPIILLTNLTERHDRFWGENAGADLYLEKSGDLTPILEAMDSMLPARHPRTDDVTASGQDVNGADIRSRITDILDRLLYESTISNEILKLTGLAHDTDLLAAEFLTFLSVISPHSTAGLLLKDGRDKFVLCIRTNDPIPEALIAQAKAQILRQAGLEENGPHLIRYLLPEHLETPRQEEPGHEFHTLRVLPIVDGGEFLASITLFDRRKKHLSSGTLHALNVAADRFLIVCRYLRKFKETEDVKADFVSMLVHDMRSPLTSIRGYNDVLAEGILGSITEEQRGAFKNIKNGCDQLLFLIEDILDLSKLEAGKMQLHPCPLSILPIVERAAAGLSMQLKDKNLFVCLDIPRDLPYVMADGKQLSRVLTNLLTNAVKFSPQAGRITLSARHETNCRGQKDCLVISVSDEGPGIPLNQQKKLFIRYQQINTGNIFRKGTGLGLAICKEIIHLHGGDVWVESPIKNNKGSRFSFSLPLAP